MSTRALVKTFRSFKDKRKKNQEICTIYHHSDGYPDGLGMVLYEFLKDFWVVNGIRRSEEKPFANGMGCLTAQLIAHLKDEPGNVSVAATGTNDIWEEYVYEIYKDDQNPQEYDSPPSIFHKLKMKVIEVCGEEKQEIYNGHISDFKKFVEQKATQDED